MLTLGAITFAMASVSAEDRLAFEAATIKPAAPNAIANRVMRGGRRLGLWRNPRARAKPGDTPFRHHYGWLLCAGQFTLFT